MLTRVLFPMLLAAAALPAAAAADWVASRQIDEFDQKHRFIAASSEKVPSLMFVCEAETGRMKLLYKSGDKATRDFRKRLPKWPVWAYVIVDDQPVRSYPGKLADIDKMVVFESYDDDAVALTKIVSAAQRRVLIAVELAGTKYFRQEIPVAGSAKPIALVLETCAKYRK